MRVDKVEFEDALSSGTMVPVMAMVEAGSVIRQSAQRVKFEPDDDGVTRHFVSGARIVICNNQLGGPSTVMVNSAGEIHLLPEALSIAVTTETPAHLVASLINMREEIVLKRILDGSSFDNDVVIGGRTREDILKRVDEELMGILKRIGCKDGVYDPCHCPLILFDAPLLATGDMPMIRKFNEVGNRIPDAWSTLEGRRCRMFAFPGIVKPEVSRGIAHVKVSGIDERQDFQHVYVIEPNSILMLSSDAMHAKFPIPGEGIGVITWITGFSIPFGKRIHRIRVSQSGKE